ARQLRHYP
ncbi:MAG: hypothetical protein COW45_03695, partial [Gallionellales bacterium CG17_big_fil_post_rev_8_21_14_2_50_54_146]